MVHEAGRLPDSVPGAVTVRVPAKINLYLGVGAVRADGYHDLVTVYQAISLYDEVTVRPAARLGIAVHGEGVGQVPTGRDNLAARAARRIAAVAGVRPSVHIDLVKAIPVAGGLAGGSADAAATLLACDALWQTGLDSDRLAALAAELGSDVPFVLRGRTALGSGRGEQLAAVLTRGSYHWVLALDEGGLETPAVYAELDRERGGAPHPEAPGPGDLLAALRAGDAVALGRVLHNDLQAAAVRLRPRISRVLDAGRELGVLGGVVCGSGPTCAFLTRDADDATRVAAALAGSGLVRTVRRAVGPVPGAALLR